MRNLIQKFWKAVSGIVVLTMAVAAVSNAATVTTANDYPSTLEAGLDANHAVVFTTPSGTSGGETMTLTFDSQFDTASIGEDDVDVEDDGVDLTTAANCAGAEQASVSVAADVVTITVCAGDGGDIAGGSQVAVKIGTNATSSGTGTNQIGNPASVGTYYVSIAGTFGDSGTIALPMLDAGSLTVSADVTQGGDVDPGEGGGGGCGDSTAPVVSSILVSGVTASAATVSWNTNEMATTAVDYGTTASYEVGTLSVGGYGVAHSVSLSGLATGTEYHFRARSSDTCGNQASSSDQVFTTDDATAPSISDVAVSLSCDTSATFTWTTDEDADSEVDYGTTVAYGSNESDAALVTSHSVTVTGLSRDTTYHYAVTSEDAFGDFDQSSDATFATDEDDAPLNVSGFSVTAGDASNALSWTNPAADFAGVVVLSCTGGYPTSQADGSCAEIYAGTGTGVTDTGLTNDTTYYYGVFAYDACGQFASGALATGTPSATEPEVPTCGDGVCSSEEDEVSCPADCHIEPSCEELGTCGGSCGDGACSADETSDSCPIDCPACVESGTCEPAGCGDGVCSADETSESCLIDCPVEPTCENLGTCGGGSCGDGACSADETSDSCPTDCPACVESGTCEPGGCGDGVCASDEDVTSCAYDCTTVIIPPTTTEAGGNVQFFVANRQIQLAPTSSGVVRMLSSRPLRVQFLPDESTKAVSRVQLVLGDGAYLMAVSEDGSSYAADVSSPGSSGSYGIAVTIYYVDGTAESITYTADVVDDGYVYATLDGETQRLGGATATLLANGTVTWDGSPYGQFNPFATGTDAQFGWYVPNTTYALGATASGYSSAATGTFSVTDNIVNRAIRLEPTPAEIAPPLSTSPIASVSASVAALGATAHEALETVRSLPGIEEAAAASIPALAVATTVATVLLALSFDLLPFLQYLFTAPFLFFWRRKRRAFGVVYNSISKAPIDLATVRLYRMPDNWQGEAGITGRLIQSRVTDKGGRHYFLVEPGRYRLTAFKSGFDFPSEILADVKDDGEYLDVYHGEPVDANERNATIAVNIPLDPSQSADYHAPAALKRRKIMRRMQQAVSVIGIVAATVFAILRPSALSIGMVGVQVAFYLLVRRLAAPRKPKSWGIVYDQKTGKPLANAIARVFESKYNKLLETAVTDSKGRYSFLLGPNEYYTSYEKPGYGSVEIHPIDYRDKKEPSEFFADVRLPREESNASSQGPSERTPHEPLTPEGSTPSASV